MTQTEGTRSNFINNIERLSKKSLLGFYTYCEVTEIFAINPDKSIINVFSILVFEEHKKPPNQTTPKLLTKNIIKLKGSNFSGFGVSRYFISLEQLNRIIHDYAKNNTWQPNTKELKLDDINFTRPYFVPPDATEESPLNAALKNNFWNGSYVMELFDQKKQHFKKFLETPILLQELSEKLQPIIPIKIAQLSDRLGNVVFQFPIDILRTQFGFQGDEAITLKIAWDKRISGRLVTAISMNEFDKTHPGFTVKEITQEQEYVILNTGDSTQLTNTYLWDKKNKILLAASGGVSAARQFNLNLKLINPEPRQIVIPTINESKEIQERIQIFSNELSRGPSINEKYDEFSYREKVSGRQYSIEQTELLKNKDFIQYGGGTRRGSKEAVNDLRSLINQYGENGAWLWDPYLNAIDIMQTLFFSPHSGSDIKALGSYDQKTRKHHNCSYAQLNDWKAQQKNIFNTVGNNHYGLHLEFRVTHGKIGWGFHDRFLIFPREEQEPRAYSLGTSINSMGKDHHILQKVSHGRAVADAFQELWNQLDANQFLVWKHPE